MVNIALDRPVVFIDLETTHLNPPFDRIVELNALKFDPDGTVKKMTRRINPEIPIPPGATSVHGIKDEDVAEQPAFSRYARSLIVFLDGCDLAGFNATRLPLPVLRAEFARAGIQFDLDGRNLVDPLTTQVKEATTRWIREVFDLPEAILIPGLLSSSTDCPIANTLKAAGILRVRVKKTRVRYGPRGDERIVLFQGKSKQFVSLFDRGYMPELEDYSSVPAIVEVQKMSAIEYGDGYGKS